jgi:hypothetical protein
MMERPASPPREQACRTHEVRPLGVRGNDTVVHIPGEHGMPRSCTLCCTLSPRDAARHPIPRSHAGCEISPIEYVDAPRVRGPHGRISAPLSKWR